MPSPLSKWVLCLGFGMTLAARNCSAQESHPRPDAGDVPIVIAGGNIRLAFAGDDWALSKAALTEWVKNDARAVALYYGRFPVQQLDLTLKPVPGRGVKQGVTYGEGTPSIRVGVGREAGNDDLTDDWILVHEMVHLALPLLPRRHHWLEEGIATYVEPIARAQSGQLSAEKVWGDMLRDMHQGMPQAGDEGLDNTPTWGRTYWGGAMFCLLADVRLREQTGNRFGLQHALRAIDRESGGIAVARSIEQVLQTGDAATGTHVLTELYREMANKPMQPDLGLLWHRLGVAQADGKIAFDDSAPLAKVRMAILSPLH